MVHHHHGRRRQSRLFNLMLLNGELLLAESLRSLCLRRLADAAGKGLYHTELEKE